MLVRCAICEKEFNLSEIDSKDFMPDVGWVCDKCWEEPPDKKEV